MDMFYTFCNDGYVLYLYCTNIAATSHMQPLNIWNVASITEELKVNKNSN